MSKPPRPLDAKDASRARNGEVRTVRLGSEDHVAARALFSLMAGVFEEPHQTLGSEYVKKLLAPSAFWAMAAYVGDHIVGGLTAHTLPMTRSESSEIFIYDIAVREDFQRRGVGRGLVDELRRQALAVGIGEVFVPADDDDLHALDFYRALGGDPAPVTIFTFSSGDRS